MQETYVLTRLMNGSRFNLLVEWENGGDYD
jgi:hypothetical protein